MAYPNPPRTWSAAAVLTAAQLNAELRDALNIIIPTASTTLAWSSFTPTFTQSATVTKTVTYAKYFQVGKIVVAGCLLSVTGSGTASNNVTIGVPITAAQSSEMMIGKGWIWDNSVTTRYKGVPALASTTTVTFYSGGDNNSTLGSGVFTAGLASPDTAGYIIIYEAA